MISEISHVVDQNSLLQINRPNPDPPYCVWIILFPSVIRHIEAITHARNA